MPYDLTIDNIASKALENSGSPDVLVVFRHAVSTMHRDNILAAIGGQIRESFATPSEEIWSVKSDETTLDALQHLAQIDGIYNLSMQFNKGPDDRFRLYMPSEGGMPLTTKHVLTVTGPQ